MSFLRGSRKVLLGIGLAGCGAAAAVLCGLADDTRIARAASLVHNHLFDNNNYLPITGSAQRNQQFQKWDFNWDKREPESLVKPLKGVFRSENEENNYNEKIEKAKAIGNLVIFNPKII